MTTRIANLRLQLQDAVSGPAKKTSAAMGQLEKDITKLGKTGVAGAKNLGNQFEHLKRKADAVGNFSQLRRGLVQTYGEFRNARSRVHELEKALGSVTKPTARMNAELRAARTALKATDSAFRQSRTAANSAAQGLKIFGLNTRTAASAQGELRRAMSQNVRLMREMERESRKPKPHPGGRNASAVANAASAVGGAGLAYGGQRLGRKSLEAGLDFDKAYHFRDALGGFSKEESTRLNTQAEKIGRDTEFTNSDVVGAQKTILQSGIRDSNQIVFLTDAVTNYARAVGVTLEQGAESVTGMALVKGIDLRDESAVKKLVDRQVWMSKNSGMSDEDLRQFSKYGGTPGKIAGLSDDTLSAIAMTLRRANIRGDEGGVAARALSSKLVAPTRKGRLALQTMDLDYNDYVSSPDAFSLSGFEAGLKENFGVRLTEDLRAQLLEKWDAEFADPESGELIPVASDTGEFVTQTMEALSAIFDGMSANDLKKVSAQIRDFHRMSAESVDAERLLDDILKKNPSLLQSNGLFTDKQGGRIAILAQNKQNYEENKKKMAATPDGIAKKIGDEATMGLSGDWLRMTGSIETVLTRVSQDLEVVTRPLIRGIDATAEAFLDLPPSVRRVIEAMGILAVGLAGFAALRTGKALLGRTLGTGNGSLKAARTSARGSVAGGSGRKAGIGVAGGGSFLLGGLGAINAIANTPTDPEELQEFMKANSERSEGWNAWLEKNIGTPQSWLGMKKSAVEAINKKAVDASEVDLALSTNRWPLQAQEAMRGFVQAVAQGGTKGEQKAAAAAAQIESILTIDGKLTVDSSALDIAIAKARNLASAIATARGGSVAAPSVGSLDPKLDGKRASGGPVKAGGVYQINEKGQELFAPGADGTIIPHHKVGQALGGGGSANPVQVAPASAPISVRIEQNFHIAGGNTDSDLLAKIAQAAGSAAENALSKAMNQLDSKLTRSAQTTFGNLSYGDA
ncbi:phage tail tape measure protein [Ochrobactrum sp. MYb379]|uniref:phage tail tape measure protein n=1 Tax=Ochrobactrum sp. MYb379 TaxID=2745275 RepID=UPI0030B3E2DB